MSGAFQFTQAPRLDEFTADRVHFQAGRRTYPDPTSIIRPMGVLYTIIDQNFIGTGTAEQVLATFSLPALSLDAAGRKLLIQATFQTVANTHAKTCKLYFGSTAISTGAITTASVPAMLQLVVTQRANADSVTPNAQLVNGFGFGGTTGIVPVVLGATPTETVGAAITIQATGQTGTSGIGDIVLNDFFVQYMN